MFLFTNLRPNDNKALEIDSIQTILTKMQLQTKFTFITAD